MCRPGSANTSRRIQKNNPRRPNLSSTDIHGLQLWIMQSCLQVPKGTSSGGTQTTNPVTQQLARLLLPSQEAADRLVLSVQRDIVWRDTNYESCDPAAGVPCREGFTRPGPFLFDLLASIGLRAETLGAMLDLMDKAKTLLADEDVQQGHR